MSSPKVIYDDPLKPTCEHRCPEGAAGIHEDGCEWSGTWLLGGRRVAVLGASPDKRTLCALVAGDAGDEHAHLPAALPALRRLG